MRLNMTFCNENIYDTHAIRDIEHNAEQQVNLSSKTLMQRAGQAAFAALLHRYPLAKRIMVFCGGGNNGGDGYVLAFLAAQHGLTVTIYQVGEHNHLSEAAKEAMTACRLAHIPITSNVSPDKTPDVIVDAICGIGLTEKLKPDLMTLIQMINQLPCPVLAIDLPTGVHADTGEILGEAIRAEYTVTFLGLKLGLVTGPGVSVTGTLICDDLNLPPDCYAHVTPCAETLSFSPPYFQKRPRDWHKGLSGHLLIIGGGMGYAGAPCMAAIAALRMGVGCVTVATHPANTMNCFYPEVMMHGIETAADLKPLLEKATALVIGPGLTQTAWAKELWQAISHESQPKLYDADALNLLAKLPMKQEDWVLTPHPGEASRLLGQTTREIQRNRLQAAKTIQEKFGGTCVLKGAGTIIAENKNLPKVCQKGNAGMATAGMGDMLSGVIGGLLASGMAPNDAAHLGVYLHALAGDLAGKTGQRGMIATDLLPHLYALCNQ